LGDPAYKMPLLAVSKYLVFHTKKNRKKKMKCVHIESICPV